jgi:hypothetical protein
VARLFRLAAAASLPQLFPIPRKCPTRVTFEIPDQKETQVTIEDLNDGGQGVLARLK